MTADDAVVADKVDRLRELGGDRGGAMTADDAAVADKVDRLRELGGDRGER